jgi:hypothetical protein
MARNPTLAHSALRLYPYPYRAILALSSDLDDTPNASHYFELIRFFNTQEQTIFGKGVGLEFAQSIFLSDAPDKFSYWNADEKARASILTLIESGHIDTLHSYGSAITLRADVQRSIAELRRAPRSLPVWVDHAIAPTNFGRYQMRGFGDISDSPSYHADLSIAYGIDYCWMGQITSVIGQNVSITPGALFHDGPSSIRSLIRSAKEICKVAIPIALSGRYALHRANHILLPVKLRDGSPVFEFLRCNPSPRGIAHGDSADFLAENISIDNLNALIKRQGVMILYTHLGRRFPVVDSPEYCALRDALEFARDFHLRGSLLVMSTSRTLDYLAVLDGLSIEVVRNGSEDRFVMRFDRSNRSLARAWLRRAGEGITIYCDSVRPCVVILPNGSSIRPKRNPPDETGKSSVSIPLEPLAQPVLG